MYGADQNHHLITIFLNQHDLDICDWKLKILDGGRNFERPIFRNLQITNVESYERSNYSNIQFLFFFLQF